MYYALVTKLQNVRKDENSNNLYLAECFFEGVIVGPNSFTGQEVLYLPTDGKIERWFGDELKLFRKNLDGTPQGGYVDDNAHVKAIKLRGNQSSGIVVPLDRIYEIWGNQGWQDGDKVTQINGKEFCSKYIPRNKKSPNLTPKSSYKGRKAEGIIYPEFSMHTDTEQLAYNLDKFHPGDQISITLKMHGTSQRSMRTYAELPRGFFRKLFKIKPKVKPAYVLGTRRCVVTENHEGFYGNDQFRLQHHEALEPYIEDKMEVFGEIVGYYGEGSEQTIMPSCDNKKINDKNFIKEFGPRTVFSYGCQPGESKMFIYRITSQNGEKEWTPEEIKSWCDEHGFNYVPIVDTFEFTTTEDLLDRINKYFEDLRDPIGKTHIKEGVVVRIVNRRTFTAYKSKTFEFRALEGLVKDSETMPDMEEAQEI